MKKITVIAADEKHNLTLAQQIKAQLNQLNTSVTLIDLVSLDLPLYTLSHEQQQGIPPKANSLYEQCITSDGFFFVTPEYNGTIPPVLSSAIAWISRVNEEWRTSFNAKPAGLASYSYTGATNLFISLRIHLSYMGLTLLGRTLSVTPSHPLNDNSLTTMCRQLIT
jgi:chromate reductase